MLKKKVWVFLALQGSADEEDLDEDDSLSDDSGSEQDELMEDSEYSEKKSQPPTPSPSPPETPRPTRRRRKARSPSYSDDENRPPSPKVITKLYIDFILDFVVLVTSSTHLYFTQLLLTNSSLTFITVMLIY